MKSLVLPWRCLLLVIVVTETSTASNATSSTAFNTASSTAPNTTSSTAPYSLSCVVKSRNWLRPDDIKLDWNLPDSINTSDPNAYIVTVTWWSSVASGECPNATLTSCTCPNHHVQCMNFNYVFNLSVSIATHVDNTELYRNTWYGVDPVRCYVAPVVDVVEGQALSNQCVNVSWHYKPQSWCMSSPVYPRQIRILYRRQARTDWEVATDANNVTSTCNGSTVVCGLAPYRVYMFTALCRRLTSDVFSENNGVAMVTTLQDVPTGTAEMVQGGFHFVNNVCIHGNTSVIIYWKDVTDDLKNGPITSFRIKTRDANDVTNTETSVAGNVFHAQLWLKCNTLYRIEITAETKIGRSSNVSSTSINTSRLSGDVKVKKVIPMLQARGFHVYWRRKGSGDATVVKDSTAFVVWCKMDLQRQCQSPINWTAIPDESTSVTVDIEDEASQFHHYKVGITLGVGGITWSTCLYHNKNEILPPRGLQLARTDDAPVGHMIVTWENGPCESQAIAQYIASFILQMCAVESRAATQCMGTGKTYTVAGEASSYTLTDLDPSYIYRIAILARYIHGRLSNASAPVYGRVERLKPVVHEPWFVLVVIVGGILFIMAVIGVVSCSRHIKQKWHEYIENNTRILMPNFHEHDQLVDKEVSV